VWKVELATNTTSDDADQNSDVPPRRETMLKVRHAQRGSIEETISLGDLFSRCEPYFDGHGRMIDQAYQTRLPEGMVRCYLVHDQVVGFGHQAINALFPAPPGALPSEAPQPGPRLYHPPTMPQFQLLKGKLEQEWVPAIQQHLGIDTASLPILWDCDFLLGPKTASGEDTHVLCEINVSSVAPFPESAPPHIASATLARVQAARKTRQSWQGPSNGSRLIP
jgi:hypothetical protein